MKRMRIFSQATPVLLVLEVLFAGLPAGSVLGVQYHISYEQYGNFDNVGTSRYSYRLSNARGLREKVIPGIYPNLPLRLGGAPISKQDLRGKMNVWLLPPRECIDFWATFDVSRSPLPELTEGVRQFNFAVCLERAGKTREAIDAYYATVVHFPYDKVAFGGEPSYRPHYLGVAAMDAIYYLTTAHAGLGLRYVGGEIDIENGFDYSLANDLMRLWPGRLLVVAPEDVTRPASAISKADRVKVNGDSRAVQWMRYKNGHWLLRVQEEPFFVKGVHYAKKSLAESAPTAQEQVWLDANDNGLKDEGEPFSNDFELMRLMGANTVFMQEEPQDPAELARIHERYGLYFILGDTLESPYTRPRLGGPRRLNFERSSVRSLLIKQYEVMARRHKDQPYLLAWALGGEHPDGPQAADTPAARRAYYEFVEEAAALIKRIDPSHPVILLTNDLTHLDLMAQAAPSVDILGVNAYRGFHGSGRTFWRILKEKWGKPVMITEYGMPSYGAGVAQDKAQKLQAFYHEQAWQDLVFHRAAGQGEGSAVGGCIFEWADAWWRNAPESRAQGSAHDTTSTNEGPFLDGKNYPEWYGLVGLNKDARVPKKAYWTYVTLWKEDVFKF